MHSQQLYDTLIIKQFNKYESINKKNRLIRILMLNLKTEGYTNVIST